MGGWLNRLPFRRVWLADFEFTTRPGERPSPICLVARELRSGCTHRWSGSDLSASTSPFCEPDAVFCAYYASADIGCCIALGWSPPLNVIDLFGWKVGFLTCYDNNLAENARITAMMGAQVIIAPHVTGCLPSNMPGRGVVDRALWDNRHRDPVPLRMEFAGPKGRGWLMRWLPTRAYENGVYYVFSNPIGWDYDTVKPGLAMILDPFGEVLVESSALEDDVVVGLLTPDKLENTSGQRYLSARRPELYGKLVEPHESATLPGWQMQR